MIKITEPQITKEDIESVTSCLQLGQISGRSPICKEFEDEYAKTFHVKHTIAVNSGTSAVFLALKALGIGEGDEVIVPAFCFMAVANAVTHTGATPVFVDVDENTFNIDPKLIRITEKTKAIIAVHTYGQPCDMDELLKFGVPVIEDAAEAHGAKYKGKMVGSIGDFGCFSFFANKTITTGEGGMVVTNNEVYANEVRKLKDQYNSNIKFKHDKVGYGMSLGAMQCALGLSQIKRLKEMVERKREIADRYTKGLLQLPQTILPLERYGYHSYWMYAIRADKGLKQYLEDHGIEIRPGFFPMSFQPPYSNGDSFPISEALYEKIVCLPCGLNLTTSSQDEVIHRIIEYYTSKGTH